MCCVSDASRGGGGVRHTGTRLTDPFISSVGIEVCSVYLLSVKLSADLAFPRVSGNLRLQVV